MSNGQHDPSYKLLFSHPQMVEDLLRGFVSGLEVERLDLASLERVSGSYVTDDLRDRADDMVWRVRGRGEWLYVYLLLEFQSTVDPYMAVRIETYLGLLYQDLVKAKALPASGKLPPVLPIVLYNGQRPWTAPTDLEGLLAVAPASLVPYRPCQRYLLLDEGRTRTQDLPTRNLVSALFRLENSRSPEDILEVVTHLVDWLRAPEHADLGRAFATWLQRVLARRWPTVALPAFHNLTELRSMLAERIDEWTEQWRQEGTEIGERIALVRLLEARFGSLSQAHRERIEAAHSDLLIVWLDRVLTAQRVEDVLDAGGPST